MFIFPPTVHNLTYSLSFAKKNICLWYAEWTFQLQISPTCILNSFDKQT